jgi:hypothetical protein
MARRSKSAIQADAGIIIPTGAGNGRVLTSDGSGVGSWQPIPGGAGDLITGTGAPAAGVGIDGTVYLDQATGRFYGPKAAGRMAGRGDRATRPARTHLRADHDGLRRNAWPRESARSRPCPSGDSQGSAKRAPAQAQGPHGHPQPPAGREL